VALVASRTRDERLSGDFPRGGRPPGLLDGGGEGVAAVCSMP
jgi:hypothetical protein